MRKITLEELKSFNPSKETLDFFTRNHMELFDFERIDEISCDYRGFKAWIKKRLNSEYKYDKHNRVISCMSPDKHLDEYSYDDNGNKALHISSDGKGKSYTYDAHNRLVFLKNAEGRTEEYSYDECNNIISAKINDRHTLHYTYDKNNNKLSCENDMSKQRVEYTYDENNNKISCKDPWGVSAIMEYDKDNRMVSCKHSDKHTEEYTYDENNNVISINTHDGKITEYKITYADGTIKDIVETVVNIEGDLRWENNESRIKEIENILYTKNKEIHYLTKELNKLLETYPQV